MLTESKLKEPAVGSGTKMTPYRECHIQCVPRMRKRPFKGTSGATFLRHYRALRR
jgi:hypothetical protein